MGIRTEKFAIKWNFTNDKNRTFLFGENVIVIVSWLDFALARGSESCITQFRWDRSECVQGYFCSWVFYIVWNGNKIILATT